MEQVDQIEQLIKLSERVAVLETKADTTAASLVSIDEKLDSLLELKAKGMGAIGLVSLVVGSGVLGLITLIYNFFTARSHL